MRTLRWTKEFERPSQHRKGQKERYIEIRYSNEEDVMIEDGWIRDGFYDTKGNRIECSDDGKEVIDVRKAPGV